MKTKLLIIILLIPLLLFAQDANQNQSIELPDFVITGVQKINIPSAKKNRPDLVSTLSKEFFTPKYSPEVFLLSDVPNPVSPKLDLVPKFNSMNGQVKVGAGIYTLPTGEFNFNKNFSNVMLYTKVWGTNEREFVDDAGYNVSGGLIKSDFFVSSKSNLLPGLQVNIFAKYFRDSYKFFGSKTPTDERKTQNTNINFGLKNTFNTSVKYGLNFSGRIMDLSENNFSENLFGTDAWAEIKSARIGIDAGAAYKRQNLVNNFSASDSYSYFSSYAKAVLEPFSHLIIKGGVHYSSRGSNTFFAPVASVLYKINNNFSVTGQYDPKSEFLTTRDLLTKNPYYLFEKVENVFKKLKHNIKGSIKYQYLKYFEISAGGGYASINNFVYFTDDSLQGKFNLHTLDNINQTFIFADMQYHLGVYGYFYGNVKWQSVKNSDGKTIPYNPSFITNLIYGYKFNPQLEVKSKLVFKNSTYTELANVNKLPAYFDLSLMFAFKFNEHLNFTLDLLNIFNKKNNQLSGYQEKPLDLIIGVDYRW